MREIEGITLVSLYIKNTVCDQVSKAQNRVSQTGKLSIYLCAIAVGIKRNRQRARQMTHNNNQGVLSLFFNITGKKNKNKKQA